jgi:hypothetical protein
MQDEEREAAMGFGRGFGGGSFGSGGGDSGIKMVAIIVIAVGFILFLCYDSCGVQTVSECDTKNSRLQSPGDFKTKWCIEEYEIDGCEDTEGDDYDCWVAMECFEDEDEAKEACDSGSYAEDN